MTNSLAPAGQSIQRVYGNQGSVAERPLAAVGAEHEVLRIPTIADLVPVTDIMTREVVCARRDLSTEALVALVTENRLGCVPVVEEPGRPVGMITRLDLIEQLLAAARDATVPPPSTAGELMLPLAITLGDRATVAHAAALMATEDVHHLPIVDGLGRVIGIVSTLDIVRWLARNDGFGTRTQLGSNRTPTEPAP